LARIEALCDARPGSAEHDELEILSVLVSAYEDRRWPVQPPESDRGDDPRHPRGVADCIGSAGGGAKDGRLIDISAAPVSDTANLKLEDSL
jgi:hypothetical protein